MFRYVAINGLGYLKFGRKNKNKKFVKHSSLKLKFWKLLTFLYFYVRHMSVNSPKLVAILLFWIFACLCGLFWGWWDTRIERRWNKNHCKILYKIQYKYLNHNNFISRVPLILSKTTLAEDAFKPMRLLQIWELWCLTDLFVHCLSTLWDQGL